MLTKDHDGRVRRSARSAVGLAVAVAATLVGPASATAAPPPAAAVAEGTQVAQAAQVATATTTATADTYVVAERPANAYGTENKLTAATWSTWHSETYLAFDVPAPPLGDRISSARITVSFQRLDAQPAAVQLRSLTGAWDESTTYATRPATGAVVATATLPGQGTTTLSFDVTGAVLGAGRLTLAMTNPTPESVASIFSRESGTRGPRLDLEFGPATLCGASFTTEGTETYQQAFAREDALFGGLDSARVFYSGLPQAWPGKLDTGGRPMIISFKAPPAEVLAGTHDVRLRDWFRTAPTGQDIYWTYFHEPENDIQNGSFTATQFRQAWQRIAALADQAGNPRLRATLILMGWSVDPASGRDWHDYYPGREYVDVIGWDLYNPSWRNGGYRPAANLFAGVIAASQSENLPFGIAETGSPLVTGDAGPGRAAWLRDVISHLAGSGALFIEYFDLDWTARSGADYRLRDADGVAVWREFCG